MIICEVNKNHLNVRTHELLTAGSQNVNTVEFRFNSEWDGLTKTATFKTAKKTVSVKLSGDVCAIPWEVLADAGEILAVGVFGVTGETIVLPTVWGILGKVADAAHLGDAEKDPTPDVYQQIIAMLEDIKAGTVSPEDIEKAVDKYLTENPVTVGLASEESPGIVAVGENLKISDTGALSVDTTDVAEEDNTKPITSSGVNVIVGNIGAILESI